VKRWLLIISVTLGFGGTGAVLLWSLLDRPVGRPPQTEAPVTSVSALVAFSGAQPIAEPGPQPTTRESARPLAAPMAASPKLDSLYDALAMQRPVEPTEAPDFTLPDVEGRPVRLRELRGKLVLLNFWATWCPPCRLEMPSMERLYQTFKQTDFAMLAVSIDRQGVQVVKPFMEELKLTFPALLDSKMEIARQYGLRGLPTTYLIDRDGRLIGAAVGGRDWYSTEAKALIARLLQTDSAATGEPARGERAEGR
jgi:peroxiredoxin